jgi:hypothetical protein
MLPYRFHTNFEDLIKGESLEMLRGLLFFLINTLWINTAIKYRDLIFIY